MKSGKRPILEIPVTPIQRLFTAISLILIIVEIFYIVIEWSSIPDRVPGHYNALGEVDRWGSKAELLALPIICFLMWLGLTFLEKYPHVYNYLTPITEENAERQYKAARSLINTLKFETVALMTYISFESIHIARAGEDSAILGAWDLPIFLGLIFGTLGIYIYKSIRAK